MPCIAISSLIRGYPKTLNPHSNIQNKHINGINDLYLKTTTQQTRQKISWANPHKEKNLERIIDVCILSLIIVYGSAKN